MFLILDFTKSLRLAIVCNDKLIDKEFKTKKNISEILIPKIDNFLKKSKTNIIEIKRIFIITGPGSFTGIRSALTFAKSLRLTMKKSIFGMSKFEILNYRIKKSKCVRRCILIHFKGNQFFIQNFKGYKNLDDPKLINFDHEKFKYNLQTTYISDNIMFQQLLGDDIFKKIKENYYLVDYNLSEINEIFLNKIIDSNDPKPLYINNYY